jgi:DNA processing protein
MPPHPDPTIFWIGLSRIPGVGRATFRKLVQHFGTPERVLSASRHELKNVDGLSEKLISGITTFSWKGPAEEELARARRADVAIITADDPAYPANLKSTPDPPLYLYVRGTLPPEDNAVAMVGTRTPTHYGQRLAQKIAYELAGAGLTVVSGMARGIDTQAHRGALEAGGRTIAVLACGIDRAYPPENRGLMEGIVRSGAVVTENPFGTKPESGYFPARNRIISGLSLGTLIIEAAHDSGSLITAEYTLEQRRRLFAVPGNVGSPTSHGPNALIKQGAVLVENADDILAALSLQKGTTTQAQSRPAPELSEEEKTVCDRITGDPKHIDLILADCNYAPGRLSGILINLELKGLIRQLPGKLFIREE